MNVSVEEIEWEHCKLNGVFHGRVDGRFHVH